MAHHQDRDRIPERPSPRSPPPPRAFEPPPPPRQKKKSKQVTRESLNKSQIRAAVAMIILVILLVIIIFIATSPISNTYNRTMARDVDTYTFEFNIPDIMSQDMPVTLDITSSENLEFYLLEEENYHTDIEITELRNFSINTNHRKTSEFYYEAELQPGKYVVVAYQQMEKELDTSLKFTINRYVPILIIWIICLIFILLFVLCIVRIALLQRRKSILRLRAPPARSWDPYAYGHEHVEGGYNDGRGHYPHGSEAPVSRPGQMSRGYPRGGSVENRYEPPPGPIRPEGPEAYSQAPGRRPPPQHGPPSQENIKPVTIPCKCGEVIVINETLRPMRIQCPRCGRRGILEGKERSPEDDIFY